MPWRRLNNVPPLAGSVQRSGTGRLPQRRKGSHPAPSPKVRWSLLLAEDHPLDPSEPEEIIARALVDGSDCDGLVETLSRYACRFPTIVPGTVDTVDSGTWYQVESASMGPMLSDEEFERICQATDPVAHDLVAIKAEQSPPAD